MNPDTVIRLGTRGSDLARWQTLHVVEQLIAAWPALQTEILVFSTHGDRVLDTPLPLLGGKGAFTAELEGALQNGVIDAAVHSLKDLPTEDAPGLALGAILPRAHPGDVLLTRSGEMLAELPAGAVIGTSSRRRAAQLLHRHPHLQIADIRGNVDTRLRKALDPTGVYDGVIFARAGLERLGLLDETMQQLPFESMLPAPGQGALAVQCRREATVRDVLAALDDTATRAEVTAERAFLAGLGGGCSVPVAALGEIRGSLLVLRGRVTAPDGSREVSVSITGTATQAAELGRELAEEALRQGAAALLEDSDA